MDSFSYRPAPSVCSTEIKIEIEDGILKKAEFVGGCPGNLTAVNRLVQNRSVKEIISLLNGIPCGRKTTSCPDQLAQALQQYLNKKGNC